MRACVFVRAHSGPAVSREGRTDGSDRAPSAGLELENMANYILINLSACVSLTPSLSVCDPVTLDHKFVMSDVHGLHFIQT